MFKERKLILNIKKENLGIISVHFIDAIGIIDYDSVGFFKDSIEPLIMTDSENIIIDGTKITKIDEIGLGILHFLQNKCWSFQGNLYLVNFSHLKNSFEELDIISIFKFANSQTEALNIIKEANNIETTNTPIFPAIISCPHCQQKMKIKKSATYRCPKCKSILKVDDALRITLIKQNA